MSSSIICTVVVEGSVVVEPGNTLLDSDVDSIESVKVSSISNWLSSVIEISNMILSFPAGMVTVYGPES